jgi:HSP20 family molecular chaperone IbpA
MSEMVESEEKTETKEVEEKPRKGIVTPNICSWTNDEGTGTIVEIYLPGVERDTIKLKMDKDNIFVAGY